MELKLIRKYFTAESTIGELYVDGVFECHILEDVDRGLYSSMGRERIGWLKQYAKTAIPYGCYEVIISFSNRFKKYMPLVSAVIGYEGIRIHPGNKAADTEGCLLPGIYDLKYKNFVGKSRLAYEKLLDKILEVEKTEKVYIVITHE